MKQILYVLASARDPRRVAEAVRRGLAQLDQGHQVLVFADTDAVHAGTEVPSSPDAATASLELAPFASLVARGACVTLCRVCCAELLVGSGQKLLPGVRAGELSDLSAMLSLADEVVSL